MNTYLFSVDFRYFLLLTMLSLILDMHRNIGRWDHPITCIFWKQMSQIIFNNIFFCKHLHLWEDLTMLFLILDMHRNIGRWDHPITCNFRKQMSQMIFNNIFFCKHLHLWEEAYSGERFYVLCVVAICSK